MATAGTMIANLELGVVGAAIGASAAATMLAGRTPQGPGPAMPTIPATRPGSDPIAPATDPAPARPAERDPVVVAVVAVVLAATATFVGAAAWWAAPVTLVAATVGLGIGSLIGTRAGVAPAPVLTAALSAAGTLYLLLPDTEGTMQVGGALVPLAAVAVIRRRPWPADAGMAATGALVGLLVAVAVTAAARRWSTLAVALTSAAIVAALVALATSVALGPLTSGRGRRSR